MEQEQDSVGIVFSKLMGWRGSVAADGGGNLLMGHLGVAAKEERQRQQRGGRGLWLVLLQLGGTLGAHDETRIGSCIQPCLQHCHLCTIHDPCLRPPCPLPSLRTAQRLWPG